MALTDHDIAQIKGMIERGDLHQDIAAWFGCNSGRIAEINHCDESRHDNKELCLRARKIAPARHDQLPPTGPYVVVPEDFVTRLSQLTRDMQSRKLESDE
jgi:hypothetical protein